jgi:hypothetical protein
MPNLFKPALLDINIADEERVSASSLQLNETRTVAFTIENKRNKAIKANVVVKNTLNMIQTMHRPNLLLPKNSKNILSASLTVPNDPSLIGKHSSISILAVPVDNKFELNFSFKTIHLPVHNVAKHISSPNCQVVGTNIDKACAKVLTDAGKCNTTDRFWTAVVKVTASELRGVHSLHVARKGRQSILIENREFDLTQSPVQFVNVVASCCSPRFDLLVSDRFSNYEKCSL